MPGGDGTGPVGMGPMTGRGAGYCAGYAVPGYANPGGGRFFGFGRGFGRGLGRGRGWRNWSYATGMPGAMRVPYAAPYAAPYSAPPAPEQELEVLRNQANDLTSALDEIRARIDELEKAKTE